MKMKMNNIRKKQQCVIVKNNYWRHQFCYFRIDFENLNIRATFNIRNTDIVIFIIGYLLYV